MSRQGELKREFGREGCRKFGKTRNMVQSDNGRNFSNGTT